MSFVSRCQLPRHFSTREAIEFRRLVAPGAAVLVVVAVAAAATIAVAILEAIAVAATTTTSGEVNEKDNDVVVD